MSSTNNGSSLQFTMQSLKMKKKTIKRKKIPKKEKKKSLKLLSPKYSITLKFVTKVKEKSKK